MSELVHVLHRPFLPSGTSTESMAMDPQHISPDAGPPHSYNNDDEFTVDRRRDPSPRLTSLIAPIPGSGTSVAAHYSPSQAPYSPAISSDDDFYLEVVDPMETPMILAASPIEQNDMVSASSPVQSSGSQGDSIPDPLLGISSSGPSIIEQDAAGKFERLSPGPLAKNGHYPRERYHEMPGYWWYHTKEEIDNMTRPEFRGRCFAIGYIMETTLGELLPQSEACDRCKRYGFECWVLSRKARGLLLRSTPTCARCRTGARAGGCMGVRTSIDPPERRRRETGEVSKWTLANQKRAANAARLSM